MGASPPRQSVRGRHLTDKSGGISRISRWQVPARSLRLAWPPLALAVPVSRERALSVHLFRSGSNSELALVPGSEQLAMTAARRRIAFASSPDPISSTKYVRTCLNRTPRIRRGLCEGVGVWMGVIDSWNMERRAIQRDARMAWLRVRAFRKLGVTSARECICHH